MLTQQISYTRGQRVDKSPNYGIVLHAQGSLRDPCHNVDLYAAGANNMFPRP